MYSNIRHNIFGFSTSVTKLQKQMPATKETASNNALDDHDVPETSIPTEFSDNDAEVENDEKYETETETETDCTTESDDEDNNDNHLHVLEQIPVKALGESQSCEWRGSCSWGWPPRQYGAQCKVWGIHNLLLHCANDYSLCTYSGKTETKTFQVMTLSETLTSTK